MFCRPGASRAAGVLAMLLTTTLGACGGRDVATAPPIALDAVPIGYGVGHRTLGTFAISPLEWRRIEVCFLPVPADPHAERLALAQALSRMHIVAGTQTPTWGDLPGDAGTIEPGGAIDCIDASKNNTTYMLVLHQRGLLRWHRVLAPATRVHLMHAHTTAVIEEVRPAGIAALPPTASPGRRWAVDTWYGNCGDSPLISPLDDWFAFVPVPFSEPVRNP